MKQADKAKLFAKLHVKGNPIIIYNAWDAGSAKIILDAGAKVIATSSWAVAAAHGYKDGEIIPFETMKSVVSRITASVDAPVTLDFESGYSDDNDTLKQNISEIISLGVIGINFEDRIVKGKGLYDLKRQARRIGAIRHATQKKRIPLFINARTDVFFGLPGDPEKLTNQTIERGKAYADAGASGLFIPGLNDAKLIARIVEAVPLPVNLLASNSLSNARLAKLGVARISYGAIPYSLAMQAISKDAKRLLKQSSPFQA